MKKHALWILSIGFKNWKHLTKMLLNSFGLKRIPSNTLKFPFKNLVMDEMLLDSTKKLKVGKCAIVNYNQLELV
jgi:hypothetical protein